MEDKTEPRLRILRIREVKYLVGLAESTIYDRMDPKSPRYDSLFPRPIKLGASAVGWVEASINEWIQSRIDASQDVSYMKPKNRASGNK
jgi:prophage regulatory protein